VIEFVERRLADLERKLADPERKLAAGDSKLAAGATLQSLADELARVPFRFRASAPGFRVAPESGDADMGLVRLQLVSGTYWSGEGDGGSLDIARQLLDALPAANFFASIEEKHLERFLETARAWPIGRADRFTLSAESLPVAQWAQDDGKPGWIEPGGNRAREIATLVPRRGRRDLRRRRDFLDGGLRRERSARRAISAPLPRRQRDRGAAAFERRERPADRRGRGLSQHGARIDA
jgi:hypothetical protein